MEVVDSRFIPYDLTTRLMSKVWYQSMDKLGFNNLFGQFDPMHVGLRGSSKSAIYLDHFPLFGKGGICF